MQKPDRRLSSLPDAPDSIFGLLFVCTGEVPLHEQEMPRSMQRDSFFGCLTANKHGHFAGLERVDSALSALGRRAALYRYVPDAQLFE
jgi:hypothetical protein